MINELKMIPPATVSREALQDGRSAIFAKLLGMTIAVVYCKRNQAGAMWIPVDGKPGVGVWNSISPASIDEYIEALKAQGVEFDSGPDLSRWVAHVTDQTTRQTN